ncbi:MAG: prephenate dehydratase [Campylobacterales bacterium]|nr:prephenate dehydratase [Campylobacterales bacterium]
MMTLEELREKIDKVDDEILELLNKRMEYVSEVGDIKNTLESAIFRPEREHSIINRLTALSKKKDGILDRKAIEAIFYEIIGVAKNLERTERVAYLGPKGTFTHQAAQMRFGSLKDYIPLASISSVFKAIDSDRAAYGVVPIENSTDGIVGETLDLLGEYDLKILAEIYMPIHHSFCSLSSSLEEITKVYSKDIAFGQCRKFLNEHGLDSVELIPVESTAKAAEMAKDEAKSAAICPHIAAKLNKLPIMFDNIEDMHDNKTRFIIIGKFPSIPSGNDKTSILAKLSNEPGSLVEFLREFEKKNINLTKIESRPAKEDKAFSYWFFIDFEGHKDEPKISRLFKKNKYDIKWLGSYVKVEDEI